MVQNMCGLVALSGSGTGLHGWLWSSPTYITGVLSASDFNNGIFLLQCGE